MIYLVVSEWVLGCKEKCLAFRHRIWKRVGEPQTWPSATEMPHSKPAPVLLLLLESHALIELIRYGNHDLLKLIR